MGYRREINLYLFGLLQFHYPDYNSRTNGSQDILSSCFYYSKLQNIDYKN